MAMNVGAFKSGDYDKVLHGIKMVTDMAHNWGDVTVKVIVESAVLTDEEKANGCFPRCPVRCGLF